MIDGLVHFALKLLEICRDVFPVVVIMIGWLMHFALKLLETCRDILPIVGTIIGFQLLVIRKPLPHPRKTIIGFSMSCWVLFFSWKGWIWLCFRWET